MNVNKPAKRNLQTKSLRGQPPNNFMGSTRSPCDPKYDSDTTSSIPGLGVRDSRGITCRAYVIATYTADDDAYVNSLAGSGIIDSKAAEGAGIFCDLWVIEPGMQGPLFAVPVMTRHHGVDDIEIWKPRPATIIVGTGETPNFDGEDGKPGDPFHDCNGDCVIVSFLGNDINTPLIVGSVTHPKATIVATKSDSPDYRYFRQIHGNKFGIEDGGKITVDFTEQSDGGSIEPDGTDAAAASPTLEIKGSNYTATIDAGGMTINRAGIVMVMDGNGFSVSLDGRNGVISGGNPIGGIRLGEEGTSQGLATIAALADIGHLLNEWLPTIMAAGAMFGTAGGIVFTPQILAGLAQATAPASVASSSPGGAGQSIKTVQLIGD